jgi:hypothetical protein
MMVKPLQLRHELSSQKLNNKTLPFSASGRLERGSEQAYDGGY